MPLIGAIGLILTAILNPEGIAAATPRWRSTSAKARGARSTARHRAEPGAGSPGRRPPGAPMALLETHDLTVTFGGLRANDEVLHRHRTRSLVGLIGPNGAGKTTFIDAITGYVRSRASVDRSTARIRGLADP